MPDMLDLFDIDMPDILDMPDIMDMWDMYILRHILTQRKVKGVSNAAAADEGPARGRPQLLSRPQLHSPGRGDGACM